VPAAVWDRLRMDCCAAVRQEALRRRELARVLKAVQQAGAPVLLLKGAALAYTVYPYPALRPMGDLDLLVRREHLELARGALERLGYVHQPEPPQRLNPFNTEFTGEVSFRYDTAGHSTLVELHWELLPVELFRRTAALNVEAWWARAAPLRVGETAGLSLAPEDALAHVCLHLAMHGFAHLLGYGDMAHIVAEGRLDWESFVGRVQRARIGVACYFSLWWARQVWQVPVPAKVLRALQPGPVRTRLGRWMTRRGAFGRPDTEHAWEHAVQLLVVDRLRDLARLLWWLFFPGRAWLRERYPLHSRGPCRLRTAWQAWAWILAHPLVVLWEGARSLAAILTPLSGG